VLVKRYWYEDQKPLPADAPGQPSGDYYVVQANINLAANVPVIGTKCIDRSFIWKTSLHRNR